MQEGGILYWQPSASIKFKNGTHSVLLLEYYSQPVKIMPTWLHNINHKFCSNYMLLVGAFILSLKQILWDKWPELLQNNTQAWPFLQIRNQVNSQTLDKWKIHPCALKLQQTPSPSASSQSSFKTTIMFVWMLVYGKAHLCRILHCCVWWIILSILKCIKTIV